MLTCCYMPYIPLSITLNVFDVRYSCFSHTTCIDLVRVGVGTKLGPGNFHPMVPQHTHNNIRLFLTYRLSNIYQVGSRGDL